MTDVRIVITTVPSREFGVELARKFVNERLAACVNVTSEVSSIYRWQGKIEESAEYMLVIKTTAEKIEALGRRLQEAHEYEVPEFLVIPVESGSEAYLGWVSESVR